MGLRDIIAAKLQQPSAHDRRSAEINEGNRAGEAKGAKILRDAKSGKASQSDLDWYNTHVSPGDPIDEKGENDRSRGGRGR